MKRELKFRAWSERVGMFNVDVLAISECTWDCPDYGKRGVSLAYQPQIKVMQYTGLKDKNGKEIYEGDILMGGVYSRYEVEWDAEQCGWNIGNHVHHFYEVTGNIYENPKLLK